MDDIDCFLAAAQNRVPCLVGLRDFVLEKVRRHERSVATDPRIDEALLVSHILVLDVGVENLRCQYVKNARAGGTQSTCAEEVAVTVTPMVADGFVSCEVDSEWKMDGLNDQVFNTAACGFYQRAARV